MIDPWGSANLEYMDLIEKFGVRPFSEVLDDVPEPSWLMRRGIVFGHRDYGRILEAIRSGSDFAVVTGMMPSGRMHIGHKMIVDQLRWYDKVGAEIFIPIADMEAYSARGIDFETSRRIAIEEYIAGYIALGLDLTKDNIHVYLQSENLMVEDLAYVLAGKVNFNELRAIYGFTGSTSMAHMYAPIIQVADILHPQLEELGGPRPTVVPVGPDQDPHIRLTRDIAGRFREKYGFILPSSTYHRFMGGLTGGKMSSSRPKSAIFLSDTPEEAEEKIRNAKTGGRETLKEQRELGGVPEDCIIYETLLYHMSGSDPELEEIYESCRNGTLMCGECKNNTAEFIRKFFEELSRKRKKALSTAGRVLEG
ncbi:tryptophanyl-tRNA synthetase [Methanothermobacter sp. CaT2]|uniref:tryptophan--tRNA ligase n=1 Tax=Methanothermobacter sp. CaT2 TaxID=866790 RepID=UPI0002CCFF49|nr:tryptophan--tRNA ligase [Methanothermobacter sp. CaT2]BAM69463.1 tryptophanyl-tRNA synthetase [Methanothermobacter sp. CaT2]